jgi:hypothetical protein
MQGIYGTKRIPQAHWLPFDPCGLSRMSRFATTLGDAEVVEHS